MRKAKVAIIGSGNIGMDLMYKVMRNPYLEMSLMVGLSNDSPRLKLAKDLGIAISDQGIQAIINDPDCCDIVFDATTAKVHVQHAPILKKLGKVAIDMTPAAVGVLVVPTFNLAENIDQDNINLISCGGQAVIPLIGAVSKITDIEYAEAINTTGSKSVGMGTRENVDEYTQETQDAFIQVGHAKTAKAIMVINPAEPPVIMHNTLYLILSELNENTAGKIEQAILNVVEEIKTYVPGYRITTYPQFDYDKKKVTVMVEIEGAGDYLPKYSGNLDIITQAGIRVAEAIAQKKFN